MPTKPIDILDYELQQERVSALARTADKMEAALEALAANPGSRELFAEAAERVWYYVIQREAMGWRDHREALAILSRALGGRRADGPEAPFVGGEARALLHLPP